MTSIWSSQATLDNDGHFSSKHVHVSSDHLEQKERFEHVQSLRSGPFAVDEDWANCELDPRTRGVLEHSMNPTSCETMSIW